MSIEFEQAVSRVLFARINWMIVFTALRQLKRRVEFEHHEQGDWMRRFAEMFIGDDEKPQDSNDGCALHE